MEKIANEKGVTVSTGSGIKRKKQKNVDNIPTLYPDFDLIAEEIKNLLIKKLRKVDPLMTLSKVLPYS